MLSSCKQQIGLFASQVTPIVIIIQYEDIYYLIIEKTGGGDFFIAVAALLYLLNSTASTPRLTSGTIESSSESILSKIA